MQDSAVISQEDTRQPWSAEAAADAIAGEGISKITGWVRRLRTMVFLVLVVSTIAISVVVYKYLDLVQRQDFENQFEAYSIKIMSSICRSLSLKLGTLRAMEVGLMSFSTHMGLSWPFVTIPDFAERAHSALQMTDAKYLAVSVHVEPEQRAEWENYTATHNGWIRNALEFQRHTERFRHLWSQNYSTSDKVPIHGYDKYGVENTETAGTSSSGPYLPLWQSYPVIPWITPYNRDGYQETYLNRSALVVQDAKITLTRPVLVPDPETTREENVNRALESFYSNLLAEDEEPYEPLSFYMYPIRDRLLHDDSYADHGHIHVSADVHNHNLEEHHGSSREGHDHYHGMDDFVHDPEWNMGKAHGTLTLAFYWRDLMNNILPDGKEAIVVVENKCSACFTYRLSGQDVYFVGRGDQHNSKYDDLGYKVKLFNDMGDDNLVRECADCRVLVDDCSFELSVYPGEAFEKDYVNDEPMLFTLLVVFIFLFAWIIFFMYDSCVERRQQAVMYSVSTSMTNVSILEEMVRERTRRLEETNKQLEDANRSVKQASALQLQHFACMSHEIRTPLNCIIGCASVMSDTKLDPLQSDSLEMIVTSGNLLLAVVNDVLDYSKLESGNVDIDMTQTNLQEVLDAVVLSMQTKARNRDISLKTDYKNELPEFFTTDSRRVQQILYNLLGNAVKFSKDNGVVELTVSAGMPIRSPTAYYPPAVEGLLTVEEVTDDDGSSEMIRFVIRDYGKGIAREKFAKIFHPFLQESTDTETLYGGSGLGLAICSKLVHRLGGAISVDSELGQWTEFVVEFPMRRGQSSIVKLSDSRVILIDNEEQVQSKMADVFGHFNVDHDIVSSVESAKAVESVEGRRNIYLAEERLWGVGFDLPYGSVLVTTGANYESKNSQGHIRCLLQTIPITLVKHLAESLHNKAAPNPPAKPAKSDTSSPGPVASLGLLEILIAEDNLINQKVLERILKRIGIENVEIAGNGKEAVDLVKSRKTFDVVLMDMQMPVMDGLEACTRIRNSSLEKRPKVIFVTAHALGSYEEECYKAGATDFLSKPCNIQSVKAVLESTFLR